MLQNPLISAHDLLNFYKFLTDFLSKSFSIWVIWPTESELRTENNIELRWNHPKCCNNYALTQISGLLNESHPRVFQTNTLSFFIAFKVRQG